MIDQIYNQTIFWDIKDHAVIDTLKFGRDFISLAKKDKIEKTE